MLAKTKSRIAAPICFFMFFTPVFMFKGYAHFILRIAVEQVFQKMILMHIY